MQSPIQRDVHPQTTTHNSRLLQSLLVHVGRLRQADAELANKCDLCRMQARQAHHSARLSCCVTMSHARFTQSHARWPAPAAAGQRAEAAPQTCRCLARTATHTSATPGPISCVLRDVLRLLPAASRRCGDRPGRQSSPQSSRHQQTANRLTQRRKGLTKQQASSSPCESKSCPIRHCGSMGRACLPRYEHNSEASESCFRKPDLQKTSTRVNTIGRTSRRVE